MRVALLSHESCREHDTGPVHPERPARLDAVIAGVAESGLEVVDVEAPRAARSDVLLVHDDSYFEMIEAFCARGGGALEPDTRVGPRSWEAALRSAGAARAAIECLDRGAADVAMVATRPPGHHALAARAMGFCLFNNIAIGSALLTKEGSRVAIVDWDVHHGNGTQDMFYQDGDVLYVSLHQAGFYPGTGSAHEQGVGAGLGATVNLPLPPGTRGEVYRWLVRHVIRPRLESFRPDWLLVSAGYDAHASDPLADIALTAADYGAMSADLADTVESGRTVYFLEGGYDLDALRTSTAATLAGRARGDAATPTDLDEARVGATAALRLAERFDL